MRENAHLTLKIFVKKKLCKWLMTKDWVLIYWVKWNFDIKLRTKEHLMAIFERINSLLSPKIRWIDGASRSKVCNSSTPTTTFWAHFHTILLLELFGWPQSERIRRFSLRCISFSHHLMRSLVFTSLRYSINALI